MYTNFNKLTISNIHVIYNPFMLTNQSLNENKNLPIGASNQL